MSASQPLLLDLVFACDCTGSMGSYIASAKQNILKIVQDIVSSEKCDVEFALVEYRDHPPQDSTFVTRVSPFTKSHKKMQEYVNQMQAQGGGDTPEAVTRALWDALNLPWRKSSARVLVLISDAPPHGLGCNGDGMPNGDPDGYDPLEIARQMAVENIVIYSVGVEPGLSSSSPFSRDFMMALAKITEGQYLPLSRADLLATCVVGGAIEEMSLSRLMDQVREKTEELQAQGLDDATIKDQVAEFMQAQNIQTNHLELDNIYGQNYDYQNRDVFATATNLRELGGSEMAKNERLNAALNAEVMAEVQKLQTPMAFYGAASPVGRSARPSFGYAAAASSSSTVGYGMLNVGAPMAYGAPMSMAYGPPAPEADFVVPEASSAPMQNVSYSTKPISYEQACKLHSRYMNSKS